MFMGTGSWNLIMTSVHAPLSLSCPFPYQSSALLSFPSFQPPFLTKSLSSGSRLFHLHLPLSTSFPICLLIFNQLLPHHRTIVFMEESGPQNIWCSLSPSSPPAHHYPKLGHLLELGTDPSPGWLESCLQL